MRALDKNLTRSRSSSTLSLRKERVRIVQKRVIMAVGFFCFPIFILTLSFPKERVDEAG